MEPELTISVTCRLTNPTVQALDEMAQEDGQSRTAIMELAVRELARKRGKEVQPAQRSLRIRRQEKSLA